MEIILIYLKLSAASLVGMFMMLLSKSSDMEITAKKANLVYEGFFTFIKRDWKAIAVNVLTIVATFLLFGGMIESSDSFFEDKTYHLFMFDLPLSLVWDVFVAVFFFATGYFGQDFILRKLVKSVQNRLLKDAIDYKTTIADTQSGTLEKPTPVQ